MREEYVTHRKAGSVVDFLNKKGGTCKRQEDCQYDSHIYYREKSAVNPPNYSNQTKTEFVKVL